MKALVGDEAQRPLFIPLPLPPVLPPRLVGRQARSPSPAEHSASFAIWGDGVDNIALDTSKEHSSLALSLSRNSR
jgi:hypothetical protein